MRYRRTGRRFDAQRVDPHWTGDVLDLPFTQVLQGERKAVADVIIDGIGD